MPFAGKDVRLNTSAEALNLVREGFIVKIADEHHSMINIMLQKTACFSDERRQDIFQLIAFARFVGLCLGNRSLPWAKEETGFVQGWDQKWPLDRD